LSATSRIGTLRNARVLCRLRANAEMCPLGIYKLRQNAAEILLLGRHGEQHALGAHVSVKRFDIGNGKAQFDFSRRIFVGSRVQRESGLEWKPNAELALKKSSMRIYSYQLEKHILPTLGELPLRNIGVAQIEACLSNLKQKGHASATLRSVRATFATVLRSAVKRGYLERNPAHGIVIREGDSKKERRFYSADQVRMLLTVLTEPCATVVAVAVLTGMRIGEIRAALEAHRPSRRHPRGGGELFLG